MPDAYRQRQQNSRQTVQARNRNENSIDPRHYRNYYDAVIDIVKETGPLSFTLYNTDDTKLDLRITKEGFYRNQETMPLKPIVAQTIIARQKDNFYQSLTESLKDKGILTKYISTIRLALLSDEAERIGNYLKFVIRDKGMQKPLFIIPGTGTSKTLYKYISDQIGLLETRRLFAYYEADIIIQMKAALEFAIMKQDVESGAAEKRESDSAKKELGIKTTKDASGKIRISADSILSKKKGGELDPRDKAKTDFVKSTIFGRKK